jgi:hypothetical protein
MQPKMDYVMWRLNLVSCFGNSCAVFEQFRILKLGIDVPEAEHSIGASERHCRRDARRRNTPDDSQQEARPKVCLYFVPPRDLRRVIHACIFLNFKFKYFNVAYSFKNSVIIIIIIFKFLKYVH